MGKFYDSVPVSAIVRIRDMMYTVKDPFRLDQGDVSFDAPETFKQAAREGDDREPHALPPDRPAPAAAQGVRGEDAEQEPHSDRDPTTRFSSTNGGTHGPLRGVSRAARARRRSDRTDPEWPPTMAMIQAAGGTSGAGAAARRSASSLGHRRRGKGHHAEDPRALPELAEQPLGRRADARGHRAPGGDCQASTTSGSSPTKPMRTSSINGDTSASRRCRACTTAPSRFTR